MRCAFGTKIVTHNGIRDRKGRAINNKKNTRVLTFPNRGVQIKDLLTVREGVEQGVVRHLVEGLQPLLESLICNRGCQKHLVIKIGDVANLGDQPEPLENANWHPSELKAGDE